MPLSDTTPGVIPIVDEEGTPLVVSSSNNYGFLLAGLSGSTVKFVSMSADSSFYVTGAVTVSNKIDANFVGLSNAATPISAALIAGTDGTNLRRLLTDTAGRLSVNINGGTVVTNPPYDGTINTAAPTVAVLNAGRDSGGILRALRTDNSGSLLVTASIDTSSSNRLWVTGSVETSVSFPVTQSVTVVNFPNSQSVVLTNTGSITGSVFVLNQTQASPAWVTGSTFITNFPSNQNVTLINTASISGSVEIIGNDSVNRLWVTGNVESSITFPSTQSVSIVNFPSSQSVILTNTGSITGSVFVLNQTQTSPAWITGSTQIVGISTITGSVGIAGNNSSTRLWVTGNVESSITFPSTQSVLVSNFPNNQNVILTNTGSVTGSVFVLNQTQTSPAWVTGSTFVTNFPSNQNVTLTNTGSITGSVAIVGNNQTTRLWVTGNVETSVTFPSTQSVLVTNFPSSQNVILTNTGSITGSVFILNQTQTNPAWITGSTFVTNFPSSQNVTLTNTGSITGSVFVLNQTQASPAWITGSTQIVGNDSSTRLWVTGNVTVNNPSGGGGGGTVDQGISGSVPWKVELRSGSVQTGISSNPIFITGSTFVTNFPSSQNVVLTNTGSITGSVFVLNQTQASPAWITGSTQIIGIPTITGSVGIVGNNQTTRLWVTGNVTVNNPSGGGGGGGTVDQGVSGSVPWKVELRSGSVQTGVPSSPVYTTQSPREFFIAYANDVATANSKHMISIFNSSSTKKLLIRRIVVTNVRQAATTGLFIRMNLLRITAHSGGTLLTPSSWDTAYTLNVGITVRTNATVTTSAGVLYSFYRVTEEHSPTGLKAGNIDNIDPNGLDFLGNGIIARPNQGVTIQCESTAGTTGVFDFMIVFEQVDV